MRDAFRARSWADVFKDGTRLSNSAASVRHLGRSRVNMLRRKELSARGQLKDVRPAENRDVQFCASRFDMTLQNLQAQ
jgi:hypothetical protein